MKSFRIILFLFFSSGVLFVEAAVNSRTDSGLIKHWAVNTTTLYVHSDNYVPANYEDADLISTVRQAADKWSAYGDFDVYVTSAFSSVANGRNDLYFSSEYPGFGQGILGVTVTTADEFTGEILEGDIIINTAYNYSATQLADVITHEIGHFVGLGHAPINGATMYYQWVDGQQDLSLDDISGIAALYPKYSTQSAEIQGVVVGGDSVGVFGAQVVAIDAEIGRVAGSTISDRDGGFKIAGLANNRTYYLYVRPLKELTSLPEYFATVKNDFCENHVDYVGGFFEGCDLKYAGHPQPVHVVDSIDVGSITIHCGLNVPFDYYKAKVADSYLSAVTSSLPILDESGESDYGRAIVGYFTDIDISNQKSDWYQLDLTNRSDLAGKVVHLNILTRSLLSSLRVEVSVYDSLGNIILQQSTPSVDRNGLLDADIHVNFVLSSSASNNNYRIQIQALGADNFIDPFAAYFTVRDVRPFYLLNLFFNQGETLGLTTSTMFEEGDKRVYFEDENQCVEGPFAFSFLPNTDLSALEQSGDDDSTPILLSCGSVDLDGESGSGGGGVMVGFLLPLLFFYTRKWAI